MSRMCLHAGGLGQQRPGCRHLVQAHGAHAARRPSACQAWLPSAGVLSWALRADPPAGGQVFHLQQAGVECGYLSGGQEYEESRDLMARLRADPPGTRILFVTPEKVARSDALMRVFDALHERQLLARPPPPALPPGLRPCDLPARVWLQADGLRGAQDRIVVDEAHCVSQWVRAHAQCYTFAAAHVCLAGRGGHAS